MSGEVFQFEPKFVERLWGGVKILEFFQAKPDWTKQAQNIGEAWMLMGFGEHNSTASNPPHRGKSLKELMRTHKIGLLGESVHQKFGEEQFPLLIKFIDAKERLSVQVHPNDLVAQNEENQPNGKTEMWFVVEAEPNAKVYYGFNQDMSPEKVRQHIEQKTIEQVLNVVPVSAGDVLYIPAGTVHAIGEGVFLAEIQQASDLTYRLYDWGRVDKAGKPRDLHLEQSLKALHYGRTDYLRLNALDLAGQQNKRSGSLQLVRSEHFNASFLYSNDQGSVFRDYGEVDSFVVVVSLDGGAWVELDGQSIPMQRGGVALLSASTQKALYKTSEENNFQLLEVVVPSN